jgi:NADH pyrophosphatase NudC (nudix superfamily)
MSGRLLNEQAHCSWCGAKVIYTAAWVSECTSCGYKNYINPKPCVNAIIKHSDKVLFVRRAIQPKKGQLDLPGGFVDIADKTIENTFYREIKEELHITPDQLSTPVYIGSGTESYNWMGVALQNLCFFFSANLLTSKDDIKLDKNENSEFLWVGHDELANIDYAWEVDRQILEQYARTIREEKS